MNRFFLTVIFFLLSVPCCISATIEPIYEDEQGKGFKDETPLTQEERNFLLERGNNAQTLGEARKNAFEHAASVLASRLVTDNTIRVSASFFFPSTAADQGQCPENSVPVGRGIAEGYIYFPSRLEGGDTSANRLAFGVGYPVSLAEAILGRELNRQGTDISVSFNGCRLFYYGTSREELTSFGLDFVTLVIHEIIHGLGFDSDIEADGSFPVREVQIAEDGFGSFILWEEGYTEGSSISLKTATIYDVQLYSRRDSKLLINLSDSQRKAAITSSVGLLWEGTDEGRNNCSYGQHMAKLQPRTTRIRLPGGKPMIQASPFNSAASIYHVETVMEDVMEKGVSVRQDMDLSLGMLKDIGWEIDYDGFPPSCVPAGVATLPPSGVKVREGESAEVTVKLDSEPMSDVVIPLRSIDSSEVVVTPHTLRFTAADWNIPKTVTVTATPDDKVEADVNYNIVLNKVESEDVFYQGFDPEDIPIFILGDLSVSFENSEYSVAENDGSISLKVKLSPAQNKEFIFNYSLRGISAYQIDYVDATGQVSFASGATESMITLGLINDDREEPQDFFEVILLDPENRGIIDSTGVTITDDDDDELTTAWLEILGCTENDWSVCSSNDTVDARTALDIKVRLSDLPRHDALMPILFNYQDGLGYLTPVHFFSFTDTEKTLSYVPIEDQFTYRGGGILEISINAIIERDYSYVVQEHDMIAKGNPSKIFLTVEETDTEPVTDSGSPPTPPDSGSPPTPPDSGSPPTPPDSGSPPTPPDSGLPPTPPDSGSPPAPPDSGSPPAPPDSGSPPAPPDNGGGLLPPKTEVSGGGGCSVVSSSITYKPKTTIFNNFFVFIMFSFFVILRGRFQLEYPD